MNMLFVGFNVNVDLYFRDKVSVLHVINFSYFCKLE